MGVPSPKLFAKKIVNWYNDHKRALPWRTTKDPYKIWLSEVILQQTRVAQGLPYYREFARQYPSVKRLAKAPVGGVLKTWEGLGYYSRARNLHACARKVVKEYDGKFPDDYKVLLSLPGIGSYTAAAIASIAFDKTHAVLDGNVYRVLARIFGNEADISSAAGKKEFEALASELLDRNHPGTYNQALMEFGALQCVPKSPDCSICIFKRSCHAFQFELQDVLPVKERKVKVKNRYFTYLVFQSSMGLAMREREGAGIWRGLYDFYLIESSRSVQPDKLIREDRELRKANSNYKIVSVGAPMKHVLTHQKITARFVIINVSSDGTFKAFLTKRGLRYYKAKTIEALPKPVLISRFLAESRILD